MSIVRSILRETPRLMLAAAGVLLVSCGDKPTAGNGPVILAKVGSQTITPVDLLAEAERRRANNLVVPEKAVLLQEMVDRLSLVERARQAKLDADLETRRTMEGVLITKLREKDLEVKLNAIDVTDEELREAYQKELAKFTKSPKARLAVLFQEMKPTMSDTKKAEVRQRMEEGVQKAKAEPAAGGRGPAATGFGPVAIDYSEDQVTRYRGGDIGWLDVGNFSYRWPKAVLEAGYGLDKGAMSGIIETDQGLFVVMKTDFRESAATSFEEARAGLRQEILTKKRRTVEEAFLQETAQLVKPEVMTSALAGIELPASPVKPAPSDEPLPPASPAVLSTSKPN